MPRKRYSDSDLRAMISLYLDGELGDADRHAVETYLAEHPEAAGRVAEDARLIDLLDDAVTAPPLDDAFDQTVMAELARLGPGQRAAHRAGLVSPAVRLRWAAEMVLLGLLGFLLWTHPWAPEISEVECRILGQSTWLHGRPAATRVIVLHRPSGAVITNATVQLRLVGQRHRELLHTARTNAEGAVDAALRLAGDLPPGNYNLVVEVDAPQGSTAVAAPIRLERRSTVAVRPLTETLPAGDTVTAELAAMDAGSGRPIGGATVDWQLDDASGVRLAAGQAQLDRAGVALIEAPTSSLLPAGPARLWASSGGATTAQMIHLAPPASRQLRLELAGVPATLEPGGPLTLTITATDHDGQPVSGALVELGIRVGGAVRQLTGTTDSAGQRPLSTTVPRSETTTDRIVISATVAGTDGRQGTLHRLVPVASAALTLTLERTQPWYIAGVENRLRVRVSDRDHQPVPAEVEARLQQGTELVSVSGTADAAGLVELPIVPPVGDGQLTVTARHQRRRGQTSQAVTALPQDKALMVVPRRSQVSPGQPFRVDLRAAGSVGEVYLDLLQAGQTVATRSVRLTGNTATLVVHPPAGLVGDLLLRAYAPHAPGGWRHGAALVKVASEPALQVGLEQDNEDPRRLRLTVTDADGQPVDASITVTATDLADPVMAGSATPRPPAQPVGFTLAASSHDWQTRRALTMQQRFFAASQWYGVAVGSLLLLIVGLWVIQRFADPLETVSRRERQAWGGVPAVHRRGAWAPLGALAAAVGVALLVATGIALAGLQAREVAETATAPSGDWLPASPPWLASAGRPLSAQLDSLTTRAPTGQTPTALTGAVLTATDGAADWILPSGGPNGWRVTAQARTRDGQTGQGNLICHLPPAFRVDLLAPQQLRIGDQLELPLWVSSPHPEPLPAIITATANGGLELASAPVQRVVLRPGRRQRLSVPVRAAEAGAGQLQIHVEARGLEHTVDRQIAVVPDTLREVHHFEGLLPGRLQVPFAVPAGASDVRLTVEATPEPTAAWDRLLATASGLPVRTVDDAAAALRADTLRLELALAVERRSEAQLETLRRRAVVAYQRLLAFRAEDGFARLPGQPAEPGATAVALAALTASRAQAPLDEMVLKRSRRWLLGQLEAIWTAPTSEPSEAVAPLPVGLIATALGGFDAGLPALAPARRALADSPAAADLPRVGLALSDKLDPTTNQLLARLADLGQRDDEHWWWPTAEAPAGELLATARAALALSRSRDHDLRRVAEAAADWLRQQPLSTGVGHGSAATTVAVVAALLAVDETPGLARGRLAADLDGQPALRATLDGGETSVLVVLAPSTGQHNLAIRFVGAGRPSYRVTLEYSHSGLTAPSAALTAGLALDRTQVGSGEVVTATLAVRNQSAGPLRELLASLPVPAGFELVAQRGLTVSGDRVLVRLPDLSAGQVTQVAVRFRAMATGSRIAPPAALVFAGGQPRPAARPRGPALSVS